MHPRGGAPFGQTSKPHTYDPPLGVRHSYGTNGIECDRIKSTAADETPTGTLAPSQAMCKLGHPEGETAWMKGASAEDIIYMVPTPSLLSWR